VLLCLTANHRNASFDLLEALSTGAHVASEALVERGDVVSGAVVLATCNRFEAYLDVEDDATDAGSVAVGTTFDALATATGVTVDDLRSQIAVLDGDAVASHLFAVTSGLESVVVGEDEIAGQVARALDSARSNGTTSSALEKLFQRASHTSRGVKNNTALGGAGRSLVRLALDLVSSRIADWSAVSVLVVGTGQYAATTVANLRDRGVTDISVFSPSGRGARFATKHSLRLATELPDAIGAAQVVITCTASLAVHPADVAPGSRLIVDLGLPRNVDPEVGAIDGVGLLDLETISLHAPLDELNAASDARAIVASAAAEFAADAVVEPAIVAYRSHIFGLLEAEIARSRKHDADGRIEQSLRHLAGVLLHGPSERARDLALEGRANDFVAAVETLYGISVPSVDAAHAAREDDAQDGLASA
jgi:glutamyl-tRNA reductase